MSEEIIQIWDDKAHTKKVYPVTTTEAIISPSGKSVADDVREQVEDGMADLSAIKSSAQVATAQAQEATTRANRAADSATIAANNLPYINVQTKTWMVFSNGSYVDSGICAEGQTEVTKDNIVRALGYQPAKDAAVMHNTGNEEINGEKVFNDDCTFDGNQTKFGGDLVTDTDFYQHGHIDQADGAFAKITALSSKIGDLDNLTTEAKGDLVAAINEAAQSGGGVFVAEYDVTTYNEIKAAHDAGKQVILEFSGYTFRLTALKSQQANFSLVASIREFEADIIRVWVSSTFNTWNYDSYRLAYRAEVEQRYAKPSKGIPATDLAQGVQDNLSQAAAIYQDYIDAQNLI